MAESVVDRSRRETSSPFSHAYVRLALRALVVVGFAGGVWFLSGSAAHAAHASGPGTSTRPVPATTQVADTEVEPVHSLYPADHVGSRHGPAGPWQAPLPAHPELCLSGTSTMGSVSHYPGGALADLPTDVVGAAAVGRRMAPAGDVTVRRLIAEVPTVSPD
jgi:hypothetical protein